MERERSRTLRRDARAEARSVSSLDFSGDGKILAAIGWEGYLTIWDVRSRSLLRDPFLVPGSGNTIVPTLRISPDGTTIAVTGRNGVTLWDVARRCKGLGAVGDGTPTTGLSFDPTGQLVAFGEQPYVNNPR